MDGEMSNDASEDLITRLRSEVASVTIRIKELESENAKLSTQLSNCCCHKTGGKVQGFVVDSERLIDESGELKRGDNKITKKTAIKRVSGTGESKSAMNHHCSRYVALKVMYFGQRFYGFASEAQMDPTVESEIFKALEKTRLLLADRKESQYSRCGRTDKGVSSVGQVIALLLRSNLRETDANATNHGEKEQFEEEIDYVRVLNRVLPKDIRVISWCYVPSDFSARFSCLSREYKYFFWKGNLNLSAMECAGNKFVGEHDFRNFCKMDALNVHNYRRHITSFQVYPCDMRYNGNQLLVINIKGSAFLWHQVRCMVAILFMIGQGLESPDVIDTLLDTHRTPRKPQYTIAPEIPLILQSCEFEGLDFKCSSDARQALCLHLENQCQNYQLQAAIFHEALLTCLPSPNGLENSDQSSLNSGRIKTKASHVPLLSRPTEPTYEERRHAKFERETVKSRAS